jgi:D-sedoheptulose 7-phosphate isomerase
VSAAGNGFALRLTRAVDAAARAHQAFVTECGADAARAAEVVRCAALEGRTVLVFGNGGSATDAQHLAAELVVRYTKSRRAVAAIALTTDTAVLTAAGNDLGFDAVFARQVEALGRRGDVAVGISTSGTSPNVVAGLRAARAAGLATIGLTGAGGGALAGLADVLVAVPSAETARVQEVHRTWIHAVCEWIEEEL